MPDTECIGQFEYLDAGGGRENPTATVCAITH
jgi:hypothetical protein